ncbi:MAG: TonB family protein, partial [Candidatus Obscuribacterales bacterium]|nr:TonB family protein [Candidatus Obscuribacterales bacterium]
YLAWAGETWEMYDKYKPWLATSILSGSLPRRGELEEYKGRYGIDNFLSSQANQNDVKVDGLEPPDREFFAKLDESVQDTVLLSVLLDLQGRAKDLKEIFEIWKAGDLEGMVNLDADEEKEFPNLRQYNKILLDDRNIKMVERLEEFIKERSGPFFVAVGSAHMGGKLGMLQLMKDNGFEVVQIQNTRPSFEGLDLEDVSDSFKFKDGPCLDERKRLYNIIEASKKKGIGTQGYLRNLEHIESLVASGRHQYEIEPEIDRAEAALSIQVAPYVKQVITPYCIEVEKLLGEKLKGEKTLEKGPMLVCTIEADGTLVGLRKSNQDKSPAGNANLAIEKIKTIGKFPPPPKAPLRLTIIASGNPALVEAWHRGVTDTSAFVAQLQSKVRSKWKIHDFPNTNSAVSTRFRILRNGTIDSVQLVHSSGSNELDEAVFRAIQSSSPLSKLPDGSRKGLIINFTFAYVVR